MSRRTTSVVVQTRIDATAASKIKMVAQVRGVSEAAIVRGWLEDVAGRFSEQTFEAELRQAVDRDRARRAALKAEFRSISTPDAAPPPPPGRPTRRGPSVVVSSRVGPDVAGKIRAIAAVKGMSEAELIRAWLEEAAAAITQSSFEDEVRDAIERDRAHRLALLRTFAAGDAARAAEVGPD